MEVVVVVVVVDVVVVVVVVVVVEVTRVLVSITPGGTQLYTVLTTAWPSPDTSTWHHHHYYHHHHHYHQIITLQFCLPWHVSTTCLVSVELEQGPGTWHSIILVADNQTDKTIHTTLLDAGCGGKTSHHWKLATELSIVYRRIVRSYNLHHGS